MGPRTFSMLAAILLACDLDAGDAPAPRVIVVARVGTLAGCEVSPRPRSPAAALWEIAVAGVTLARIESPAAGAAAPSLEELQKILLPPSSGPASTPVLIDMPRPPPAPGTAAPASAELSRLEEIFQPPPPPSPREVEVIAALRKALGAGGDGGKSGGEPGKGFRTEDEALAAIAAAPLSLVRIEGVGDGDEDARRRDALLGRIHGLAGEGSHIIVVALPASGDGSATGAGPTFKSGRVIQDRMPIDAVRAALGRLLGVAPADSEKDAGQELFR